MLDLDAKIRALGGRKKVKLGGPIAGAIWAWFAALPLIGQIIVGAIAVAGLFYFARLLQRPALRLDGATSRTYGWNAQQNTIGLGVAIPIVYGEHKVFGHVIQQFIETVNDDQYLHTLILLSEGEINSITDIKINDQPVANFADVQTETRVGTSGQSTIPWFSDTRTTMTHGITLDADPSSSIFTFPVGTTGQAFIVALRFPNGLFTVASDGNLQSNVVNVTIEYRNFGDIPWTLFTTTNIREAKRASFTRAFRLDNLAANRWEIRVTRNSTGDRTAQSQYSMIYDTVDRITYGSTSYPNLALLGVRIRATDQLSGSSPRISCLVQGRKVRTRSAGTWTGEIYNNNPVWCLVDLLTSVRYGLGAYIVDADLDIPALESAAAYADESVADPPPATPRFRLNVGLDEQRSAWETVDVILATCRGALVESDNVYRLVIDRPTTVSQVFGNANIDSFVNAWVSKREEFTQVEVVFMDRANDYTRETVLFPASVSNPKTKRIELPGITERAQAVREAKYHMNAMSALSRYVEFDCFLEALAVEVGDLIETSHDLPQWGFHGRIIAAVLVTGSTYDITVDRDDLPTPTAHSMLVRHETDLVETATVSSLTGRVVRVVGLTRLPLVRDSLYAYGPTNSTSKQFRVMQVTLNPDLTRHVTALEYNATIYDATGLVLPGRSPSLLPNLQAPPGSVTALALNEQLLRNEQGIYVSRVQVSWNNPVWAAGQGQYDRAEIWLSRDGGNTYAIIGSTVEAPFVTQTLPLAAYTIKVVTVSTNQVRQSLASAATATITLLGENANPSNVTGLAGTFVGRTIRLTWNTVVDADIDYYELRLSDTLWGTVNADLVGRTQSNEFLWPAQSVRTRTIFIRARDMGGRYSTTSGSVTVTNAAPGAIAAPVANAYFSMIEVVWAASGETDVIGYDLHASQTSGFTPSATTRITRIDGRLSEHYFFRGAAPSQTWFFKIAAVDELSDVLADYVYSAQGSAATTQIVTADLIDAIINTAKLGTGVVTNDKIAARTILADRLIVANFSNLVEEPGFEDNGVAWTLDASAVVLTDSTQARSGDRVLRITRAATEQNARGRQDIFALPGDKYYCSIWMRSTQVSVINSGFLVESFDRLGVSTGGIALGDAGVTTAYVEYTGVFTVPANTVKIRFRARVSSTAPVGYQVAYDDILVRRLIGSSFIEDLAVTNAKIQSLLADKISGGDITAATIGIGRSTNPAITIDGGTREIRFRDAGGTVRIRMGTPTVT